VSTACRTTTASRTKVWTALLVLSSGSFCYGYIRWCETERTECKVRFEELHCLRIDSVFAVGNLGYIHATGTTHSAILLRAVLIPAVCSPFHLILRPVRNECRKLLQVSTGAMVMATACSRTRLLKPKRVY
jgi:hypothetical protein